MEKLKETDIEELKSYIGKEPEYNIFILGDIENFGLEGDMVEVFADKRDGEYDSIILRYQSSYIVYSQKENYDVKSVWRFLENRGKDVISGKSSIVDQLLPYSGAKHSKDYLSKLTQVNYKSSVPAEMELRELTHRDAADIVDLFIQIEEFEGYTKERRERLIREKEEVLKLGTDRVLGVFSGKKLVSVSQVSAENSVSAMIVGVATHPDYRKKGLASTLVASQCQQCLDKGLEFICLFYINPAAGAIYRKIGFKEIGNYTMLNF